MSAQDMAKMASPAAGTNLIGCGSTAQLDPGTPKGTYTVVVMGTAGSGSSLSQTSVNIPITIR